MTEMLACGPTQNLAHASIILRRFSKPSPRRYACSVASPTLWASAKFRQFAGKVGFISHPVPERGSKSVRCRGSVHSAQQTEHRHVGEGRTNPAAVKEVAGARGGAQEFDGR